MSKDMAPAADGQRDAILMEVAGWIEERDFISLRGILARRKRVREDAALRVEVSKDVRSRMADMIRGRMANKVGDPLEFLSDVKAGRYDKVVTGYILREAIALGDKGMLRVCVLTQIAGPRNNTVDGSAEYRIELTEKGDDALRARAEMEGE